MKRVIAFILVLFLIIGNINVISAANTITPWQDAYAKFLMNPANIKDENGWYAFSFALYDMNKDGVPELLLECFVGERLYTYIYTYTKNSVIYVGSLAGYIKEVVSISKNPNFPGVFKLLAGYGLPNVYTNYAEFKNGEIVETPVYEEDWDGNIIEISNKTLYEENKKATNLETYELNMTNIQKIFYNKIAHYYADSLYECILQSEKAAGFLIDMDGDGFDEMVVVKSYKLVDAPYVTIYDIENGKNIKVEIKIEDFEMYGYLSNTNYFIITLLFHDCIIGEYKNGKIIEHDLTTPGMDGTDYYYDGKKITEAQYDEYLKKFGIDNIKLYLWDISGQKNDNAKIIAMTNTPKVGDPLGDVLYSDIKAYINGNAIPTSVIKGKTLVVVEDLAKYGFDVTWSAKDKTLKVELNKNKKITPLTVAKNTKPVGTFKCKYLFTDIKTYLSGQQVESYAINGVTLIDFELLAKYGTLNWNSKTKEIQLVIK